MKTKTTASRPKRRLRGGALMYVMVTAVGVVGTLTSLVGFSTEVKRREDLNFDKAAGQAELDGMVEAARKVIRDRAYAGTLPGDMVFNINLTDRGTEMVENNLDHSNPDPLVRNPDDPVETDTSRGSNNACFVSPTGDPDDDDDDDEIGGFVGFLIDVFFPWMNNAGNGRGNGNGGRGASVNQNFNGNDPHGNSINRRNQRNQTSRNIFTTSRDDWMTGAFLLEANTETRSFNYGRRVIIGIPWVRTIDNGSLRRKTYSMRWANAAFVHVDSTTTSSGLDSNMVFGALGPNGLPVYRVPGASSAPVYHFDANTREMLWWRAGYTANPATEIRFESEGTEQLPVNFLDSLPEGWMAAGKSQIHHYSGSFTVDSVSDIAGISMSITGDDDFFVFINGRLALSCGGMKPAATVSNLDRSGIRVGTNRVDFFYANRRSTGTMNINTNLRFRPTVPYEYFSVERPSSGSSGITANVSYAQSEFDNNSTGMLVTTGAAVPTLRLDARSIGGSSRSLFSHGSLTLYAPTSVSVMDLVSASMSSGWGNASPLAFKASSVGVGNSNGVSYTRHTLLIEPGTLRARFLNWAFNRSLLLSAGGPVFIADAGTVVSYQPVSPAMFLYTGPAVTDQGVGLFVGDLHSTAEEFNVNGNTFIHEAAFNHDGTNVVNGTYVSVRDNVQKTTRVIANRFILASTNPPKIMLDPVSFRDRANLIDNTGSSISITGSFNSPTGFSTPMLYSENKVTVNNLSAPNGGWIFSTQEIILQGQVNAPAGKEIYIVSLGGVRTQGNTTLQNVHVVTTQNFDQSGTIDMTGSLWIQGNFNQNKTFNLTAVNAQALPFGITVPNIVTRAGTLIINGNVDEDGIAQSGNGGNSPNGP